MLPLQFAMADAGRAEDVARLVNSAYRGDSSRQGWTTEADILGGQRVDAAMVLEAVASPETCIVLAYLPAGNELVGCFQLEGRGTPCAHLGMLSVAPSRQNQGIATKLLARADEVAQSWSSTRVQMTVISLRTELIAFYERRGFRKTGNVEPFPSDDPRYVHL
jgi:GNAT superfamily N-acetyltransferase